MNGREQISDEQLQRIVRLIFSVSDRALSPVAIKKIARLVIQRLIEEDAKKKLVSKG